MKKITLSLVTALLLSAFLMTMAHAADRKKIGLGVIAGEPTGLTAKFMLNDRDAIDVGTGWKTSGDNEFSLYGDYLFHLYDVFKLSPGQGQLPLYCGLGLRFMDRQNKDDKFGVRIPVGVEYLFENVPFGAFFELVPTLNLTPDTDFDLEGGIGIRFFF